MKILIVDDDEDIRFLLKSYLESDGYNDILTVASAKEAFDMLEKEGANIQKENGREDPVDLILMDIIMHGIDGVEACRQIKGNVRLKDIPVIMVTSMKKVDYLKSAFDAGVADFVTKPVNRIELAARVRSILALKAEMDKRKAREEELEKALGEIKVLSGLLPICSHCKKIRNDEGYWQHIEKYISDHSNANFTHGICNECLHQFYPEITDES